MGEKSIGAMILSSFSKLGFISTSPYPLLLLPQGRLYYYNEVTALNNSSRVIHIKTGRKNAYISVNLSAGSEATVSLLENPTVTSDGTAVQIMNYSRDDVDDNLFTKFYHTPTVTGGTGKTIKSNQSGFGTNPGNAQSGASGTDRPYRLKKNSDYVYTITMAGNSKIIFGVEIFEED